MGREERAQTVEGRFPDIRARRNFHQWQLQQSLPTHTSTAGAATQPLTKSWHRVPYYTTTTTTDTTLHQLLQILQLLRNYNYRKRSNKRPECLLVRVVGSTKVIPLLNMLTGSATWTWNVNTLSMEQFRGTVRTCLTRIKLARWKYFRSHTSNTSFSEIYSVNVRHMTLKEHPRRLTSLEQNSLMMFWTRPEEIQNGNIYW